MRKAFTLIECLLCLAIVAVLIALLLPAILAAKRTAENIQSRKEWYAKRETFVAKVILWRGVYSELRQRSTQRVDVTRDKNHTTSLPATSAELTPTGLVEILDNENDESLPKYDAETIQVNLSVGAWYQIETVGVRQDETGHYPNIIKMIRIPDPPPVAEVDLP